MRRAGVVVGLLAGFAAILEGQGGFQTFPKFQAAVHVVVSADIGALMTPPGNGLVLLPAPEELPVGTFGVRKGDNGSGPVIVRRVDEEPIDGWNQLTLAMYGDACTLANTGEEYILVSCTSALPGTNGGQHRTPRRSIYPHFFVGPWDRGAVIRYVNDTGESGNVVLPSPATIGFQPGGYRGGFRVTVMAAGLPEDCECFVAILAPGSGIHRIGDALLLTKPFETVTLDFDGHEWFVESHYVWSGTIDKP